MPGSLGKISDCYFNLTNFFASKLLINDRKIFAECVFDIFDGLGFS